MKLLKNYFTKGIEESQSLANIFMKDGDQDIEANYRGQAEAYRLCLTYYDSIGEDLDKFIEDMDVIKDFYRKVYLVEADSMSYYSGLYYELDLILMEIK